MNPPPNEYWIAVSKILASNKYEVKRIAFDLDFSGLVDSISPPSGLNITAEKSRLKSDMNDGRVGIPKLHATAAMLLSFKNANAHRLEYSKSKLPWFWSTLSEMWRHINPDSQPTLHWQILPLHGQSSRGGNGDDDGKVLIYRKDARGRYLKLFFEERLKLSPRGIRLWEMLRDKDGITYRVDKHHKPLLREIIKKEEIQSVIQGLRPEDDQEEIQMKPTTDAIATNDLHSSPRVDWEVLAQFWDTKTKEWCFENLRDAPFPVPMTHGFDVDEKPGISIHGRATDSCYLYVISLEGSRRPDGTRAVTLLEPGNVNAPMRLKANQEFYLPDKDDNVYTQNLPSGTTSTECILLLTTGEALSADMLDSLHDQIAHADWVGHQGMPTKPLRANSVIVVKTEGASLRGFSRELSPRVRNAHPLQTFVNEVANQFAGHASAIAFRTNQNSIR